MPVRPVISHVIEYACQYTTHLKKKHKIWHDGKLKYFQLNNKIQLYTSEANGNVLLCSEFVTNVKKLNNCINHNNFGLEGCQIFQNYLIVIDEILCQYDRELHSVNKDSGNYNISISKYTYQLSPVANNSDTRHKFSLKVNGPFKPPKMVKNEITRENFIGKIDSVESEKSKTDVHVQSASINTNQPVVKRFRSSRKPIKHEPIILSEDFLEYR